ncbi:MAG: DUF2330 domain-containing protein [Pseudomonadota bacterium]
MFTLSTARAFAGAALICAGLLTTSASAFCGFYVAKADGDLFNEASKVVMVRDQDRTVITMVNDYQGAADEFAMVIPTPVVLQREQIHVTENAIVDHLDAYTAPRMVEYFDADPCQPPVTLRMLSGTMAMEAAPAGAPQDRAKALGVTIEAEYTVGEYDILILSAKESAGLQTWLDQEGYNVPAKARKVLASYLAQGMKFFVAKVNLEEKAKLGGEFLRPLQIAFESEKFMLPIRLGTVNAKGKQDLVLFTLTRTGRVEAANYRTQKIPSNVEVPLYVQAEFGDFYKAMFATVVEREGGSTVFTEYAWDMGWCDPCAADPLSVSELRELGVFWLPDRPAPAQGQRIAPPQGVDVFVTRLHMRYDAETFPEDLRLHETGDRENFQGRYITRHAFKGDLNCAAGQDYLTELNNRYSREAKMLANLTGWDIADIRAAMAENGQDADALPDPKPWWETIWKE